MREALVHTPDGIRDVYGDEMIRKAKVLDSIHHVFHTYNFRDIETPTFEFFNILPHKVILVFIYVGIGNPTIILNIITINVHNREILERSFERKGELIPAIVIRGK